jgi:hypothetical protein
VFVLGRPFQPYIIFAGKVKSLPKSGASEKGIMKLSITTINEMPLSLTLLSIMGLFATLSITRLIAIMLSVILLSGALFCYAVCHYA